jgi:hypothetical protein
MARFTSDSRGNLTGQADISSDTDCAAKVISRPVAWLALAFL